MHAPCSRAILTMAGLVTGPCLHSRTRPCYIPCASHRSSRCYRTRGRGSSLSRIHSYSSVSLCIFVPYYHMRGPRTPRTSFKRQRLHANPGLLTPVLGDECPTDHSSDRLACHRTDDETDGPADYSFQQAYVYHLHCVTLVGVPPTAGPGLLPGIAPKRDSLIRRDAHSSHPPQPPSMPSQFPAASRGSTTGPATTAAVPTAIHFISPILITSK